MCSIKPHQYACTTGFENFEIMLINPVPVPELGGIGLLEDKIYGIQEHGIQNFHIVVVLPTL